MLHSFYNVHFCLSLDLWDLMVIVIFTVVTMNWNIFIQFLNSFFSFFQLQFPVLISEWRYTRSCVSSHKQKVHKPLPFMNFYYKKGETIKKNKQSVSYASDW